MWRDWIWFCWMMDLSNGEKNDDDDDDRVVKDLVEEVVVVTMCLLHIEIALLPEALMESMVMSMGDILFLLNV